MTAMQAHLPSHNEGLQQEDLTSQAEQAAKQGGWVMFHLSDDRNNIGVKFVPGNSNCQVIEVNAMRHPDNSLILAAILRGSLSNTSVDRTEQVQQQEEQPIHNIQIQEEKPQGSEGGSNSDDEDKKWVEKMRGWLMILATVVFSATYQAGLSPPGGLWQDNEDGHKAGTPIKRHNNPGSFEIFSISNTVAMAQSIVILLLLVKRAVFRSSVVYIHALRVLVATSLLALVTAYSTCFDDLLQYVFFWIFCNALLVSLLVTAGRKLKDSSRSAPQKVRKWVRKYNGWIVVIISISIFVVATAANSNGWSIRWTSFGTAFLYIVGSIVWMA